MTEIEFGQLIDQRTIEFGREWTQKISVNGTKFILKFTIGNILPIHRDVFPASDCCGLLLRAFKPYCSCGTLWLHNAKDSDVVPHNSILLQENDEYWEAVYPNEYERIVAQNEWATVVEPTLTQLTNPLPVGSVL